MTTNVWDQLLLGGSLHHFASILQNATGGLSPWNTTENSDMLAKEIYGTDAVVTIFRDYTKGQAVEARYRKRWKWYNGTIIKCSNLKCDIQYDDGDTDHNLPVEYIRALDEKSSY